MSITRHAKQSRTNLRAGSISAKATRKRSMTRMEKKPKKDKAHNHEERGEEPWEEDPWMRLQRLAANSIISTKNYSVRFEPRYSAETILLQVVGRLRCKGPGSTRSVSFRAADDSDDAFQKSLREAGACMWQSNPPRNRA